MKSQKRLGKGLKDISHCFILPSPERPERIVPLPGRPSECRIVSVVDDLYPLYSSALAFSLGRALAERGWETLLIDGVMKFPRLSFMFKAVAPGISVSHFLGPRGETADPVVQVVPRLKYFLPPFNLPDFKRLNADQMTSVFSSIRREASRPHFVVLRVPPQEEAGALCRLSTDVVFLVPADGQMIQSYQRVKRVTLGLRPERVGIVIAGAVNRTQAYQVWTKFCKGMNLFLGVSTDFLGYLPKIRDLGELLSGRTTETMAGSEIALKLLDNEKKKTAPGSRSLENFLKGIENLLQGGEMTEEEKNFFN